MKANPKTALLIVSLGLGVAAFAQKVPISKTGYVSKIGAPKKGLSGQDAKFIKDASAGNQFEIQSSQVAMKNGASPFVRQFAKEMIVDHGAAYNELKVLATKKGKTAPKALPPDKQAIVDRLKGLRGAAFDAAYQKAQVAAHAETAAKMSKEIQGGNDADVKSYAIKTLPAVKMHQKMLATKTTMMGKTKMKM